MASMQTSFTQLRYPLSSLSGSPNGNFAAVGSHDGLHLVEARSDDGGLESVRWLGKAAQRGRITNDLHWNPFTSHSSIVSGSFDGTLAVWNLEWGSGPVASWKAHPRTVNCVRWSPSNPNILLSCAQNGAIHVWDIRTPKLGPSNMPEKPLNSFSSSPTAVRNVAWNPHYAGDVASEFVTVLDAGSVVEWDLRGVNDKQTGKLAPKVVIRCAHLGPALTVDWHPVSRRTVVTGGNDKKIRVWDLHAGTLSSQYSTAKSHCSASIATIADVSHIRWRPQQGDWFRRRANLGSELASVSLQTDYRILLWNCSQPNFPVRTLRVSQDQPVVGLCWTPDGQMVWAASKDGKVTRSSLREGRRIIDSLPSTTVDFNVHEDIATSHGRLNRSSRTAQPPSGTPAPKRGRGPTKHGSVGQVANNVTFVYLAQNYVLGDDMASNPFDHNACVAERAKCEDIAHMWRSLGLLWQTEIGPASLNLPDWAGGPVSPCRGYTLDMISLFASAGDVQTATVVASVMAANGVTDLGSIKIVQRCSHLYIDILQQMKLFVVATATIRSSPVDAIRLSNRLSTTVYTKRTGKRPTQDRYSQTQDPSATCPVCKKDITTLFSWCQGCGHGGHAFCLQDWHVTRGMGICSEKGCSHQCVV